MKMVSDDSVPDGSVAPAAYCDADFDAICSRLGVSPADRYIVYGKKLEKPSKRYRCIGVILDSRRFATLLKMDGEEYFQIWLQRVGYGYRLDEVEEIREHIGVQARDIVLLDNDLKWIQSDLPDVDFKKMTVEWAEKKGWGKA